MAYLKRLVVIKPSGKDGSHFPLNRKACVFGRGLECNIRIQFPEVACRHCKVEIHRHEAILINFCTTFPTKLNGAYVKEPVKLEHGDIITVADRSFRFESGCVPGGSNTTYYREQSYKEVKEDIIEESQRLGVDARTPGSDPVELCDRAPENDAVELCDRAPENDAVELCDRTPENDAVELCDRAPENDAVELCDRAPENDAVELCDTSIFTNVEVPPESRRNLQCQEHIPQLLAQREQKFDMVCQQKAGVNSFYHSSSDIKDTKEKLPPIKKHVSFGAQLRPEVFDKHLPSNMPLQRGEAPTKHPLLETHPRSVLKKTIKLPMEQAQNEFNTGHPVNCASIATTGREFVGEEKIPLWLSNTLKCSPQKTNTRTHFTGMKKWVNQRKVAPAFPELKQSPTPLKNTHEPGDNESRVSRQWEDSNFWSRFANLRRSQQIEEKTHESQRNEPMFPRVCHYNKIFSEMPDSMTSQRSAKKRERERFESEETKFPQI